MKMMKVLGIGLLTLALSASRSHAWLTAGTVSCDANQSGQIDAGDQPVLGVLIVVTNTSGTFSNGNFTATPGGDFAIELPPGADSYVEFIHPLTLPAGSTVTLPASGTIAFSLTASVSNFFGGNFLIANPACLQSTNQPPPPPPQSNTCCLAGSASITGSGTAKNPQFTISATVSPGCRCDREDSGDFTIVANGVRLQFKGTVAEILSCSEVVDQASGALIHAIDVQGVGTLKGINGCKSNFGLVYFTAHVEDRSDAHLADAIYFRAYAADDTTLLLISGDTANPLNVSPLAITKGNLIVGSDCCEENGHGGKGNGKGEGEGGKGHGKGEGEGRKGKGREQGDQDNDHGNKGKGNQDCNDQGKGNSKGNQNKGQNGRR